VSTPLDEARRAELVSSLGAVRARIADDCAAAGRDPRSVTLVAVTKTYPASDVAILAGLGVQDVGESRDQEAAAKVAQVRELLEHTEHAPQLRWHFVGRLQSRKCRSVGGYAYAVHSLDRVDLVPLLADGAARAQRPPVEVFVQVSLDDDPKRGGVARAGVDQLADAVAASEQLRLRGVMAVAPLAANPDDAFAELAELSVRLQRSHPEADGLSAGMTHDLDAALRHGSTHVRIGTALLGRRPPEIG
jgi:pyridoxal phosphate enzyme (YggS family)